MHPSSRSVSRLCRPKQRRVEAVSHAVACACFVVRRAFSVPVLDPSAMTAAAIAPFACLQG